jgi:hypothetical protein
VLELSRSMTIRDAARHIGVGWDLVKEIQKRDLSRRYARGNGGQACFLVSATAGQWGSGVNGAEFERK